MIKEFTQNKDCPINIIRNSRYLYEGLPNFEINNVLIVSNIGKTDNYFNNPQVSLFLELIENHYSVNFYAWRTNENVHFMFLRPKNLYNELVILMKNELINILNEIEKYDKN